MAHPNPNQLDELVREMRLKFPRIEIRCHAGSRERFTQWIRRILPPEEAIPPLKTVVSMGGIMVYFDECLPPGRAYLLEYGDGPRGEWIGIEVPTGFKEIWKDEYAVPKDVG